MVLLNPCIFFLDDDSSLVVYLGLGILHRSGTRTSSSFSFVQIKFLGGRGVNPFTTGTPFFFFLTILLEFSIGRDLGALKGSCSRVEEPQDETKQWLRHLYHHTSYIPT